MTDFITTAVPFFFVLAVTYGALEVSGVFKNNRVNAIIALALSFFAISSPSFIGFVNAILPYAAMLFIAFFLLSFVLKAFSGKGGERDWTLIIIILILAAVFITNYGYDWLQSNFMIPDSDNFIALAGLGLIAVVFYAAYQKGKSG